MATTRHRVRVARGVYDDQYGRAAVVKVGSDATAHRREKRFPPGYPLDAIQAWQATERAALLNERVDVARADTPVPVRGTYAADLPRFLDRIRNRVAFKSDRSHARAWLRFIGPLARTAIRPSHVTAAIEVWRAEGKSARTIRHRVRVLRELYQTLDLAHARPPTKGVKLPTVAASSPRPVDHAIIQQVAKSLKAGKRHAKGYGGDSDVAYARFLVRAMTGQRPVQIGRAEPGDVDLQRKIWWVRPAKHGVPVPLPLDADMITAWKVFIKVNAWGPFDPRSFSKTIRRHGWPAHVRPYNLRHTFAIDHLLAGTSIGDVQGLLGHRQIETTRKHYAPVLLARLRKTVGKRRLKLA